MEKEDMWDNSGVSSPRRPVYLVNAISLNMLGDGEGFLRSVGFHCYEMVNPPEDLSSYVSYIGHKELASILGVACNRATLKVGIGDHLICAQYTGQRLPEGATSLPPDAKITWWEVSVRDLTD